MRLGVSSYTYVWSIGVPGFPQPAKPLTAMQLVDRARQAGVHVLQVADNLPLDRLSPKELDELRDHAREKEVDLEVGTWGIQPEQLRTYLQIAQRLSSPLVRTVIDTELQATRDEIVSAIKPVLPEFAQAGVTLAIENHDLLRAAHLAQIVAQCDSQFVGVCLDTANSLGCGEDLFTVLGLLAPYVVNVHYKDFVAHRLPHKKGFTIEGCPAGDGLVNFLGLMSALEKRDYDGNVMIELWPPPEATLEQSIEKEIMWANLSVDFLRQFILA